ncbi:MAG: hypothetical protein QOI53_3123 [Verrucomicrobiota bacterium]|nr:hypothetical protein [Verrucomicrobiota bacterium]
MPDNQGEYLMDRIRTRSTNRNIHPAGSSEILCLSYYLDHNHLHSGRCLRSTVTSLKACTCMYRPPKMACEFLAPNR